MKVLMVLSDNTFPPDIRVKKEANALISAGYKVFLIARKGRDQIKKEVVENVHVYRINMPFLTIPLLGGFLYFFIYRYLLLYHILFLSKKYRINVLHVHDLPFALATCLAGKIIQKPVIFDMHEDYVEMMIWNVKDKKGLRKLIGLLIAKLLELEERICTILSVKILVVVEEEIKRLAEIGVPLEKIEVIHNTPDLERINNIVLSNHNTKFKTKFKNKFILCYAGGFSRHRGLDTLVKAMPIILKDIPNAHLLLIGNGEMKDELLELCKNLSIRKNVTFTGWVPFEEVINYIKMSDICVIPYHKTRQTNKSFPHKLGQYMYLGKPILVSDVDSLKRIIEETQCGIVFEAGNPNDLAKKIVSAKKQKILERLGRNGWIAATTKYNWRITSKKLIQLYAQLMNQTGGEYK